MESEESARRAAEKAEEAGRRAAERARRHRERWERGGKSCSRADAAGRQLMGVLLIAVGGLFVLNNLGIIQVQDFWDFWPVILVVIGLQHLSRWRAGHFPVFGLILTLMGAGLLVRNLGFVEFNVWRYFWPTLLILWGAAMLYRRTSWHAPSSAAAGTPATHAARVDEWVIFGGVHRKIDSQEFEGGQVFAAFGGVELDLRGAATKKEEVVIDASAVFGGVEILAPEDWNVSVTGTGIFGGYEDETVARPVSGQQQRPRLVVTGSAIFGGVNVKN
jgi:predicted membrane protein